MRLMHLKVVAAFYVIMLGNQSFAGGLHCHYCPPENNVCLPRPDCKPFDGNERMLNAKRGDESFLSKPRDAHGSDAVMPN